MQYHLPRKETFKNKLFNRQAILSGDQKVWMGPGQLGNELDPNYDYAPPTEWPQLLRMPQIVVLELGTTWSSELITNRTFGFWPNFDTNGNMIDVGEPEYQANATESDITTGDEVDYSSTVAAVKATIESLRPGKTFVFDSWASPGVGINALNFPPAMDSDNNLITPQDYLGCDYLKIIMNTLYTTVSVPVMDVDPEINVSLQRAFLEEFRNKCIVDFRRQRDKFYNYKVYHGVYPPAYRTRSAGSVPGYTPSPTPPPPDPDLESWVHWIDPYTGAAMYTSLTDYIIFRKEYFAQGITDYNSYASSLESGPVIFGDPGNPSDNLQYFNTSAFMEPIINQINGELEEEVITFLGEVGVSMSAGYIMDLIANHFKFDLGSGQDL